MLDETATNGSTVATPATKIATMPHTTNVPVTGKTVDQKTIDEMAGQWSDFKFAPIREVRQQFAVQVLLLADNRPLEPSLPCHDEALLRGPRQVRRV
jgi:hypothetical protein